MITTLKQAEAIAGKLSWPSKMPGPSYGIPAWACPVGSLLVKLKGSVCSSCYALKGRYRFGNVQAAQNRRLQSLTHPQWVDAMVYMIDASDCRHFRWHDSGDIQNRAHLDKIVEVANRCPEVSFWLPTREQRLVRQYGAFPPNLVVRVSGAMIDGTVPQGFRNTSTVVTSGHTCPASTQEGKCGRCRACWDPAVANVAYPLH